MFSTKSSDLSFMTWVDYEGTWVREKMISFAHNNFVMIQPLKSENFELAAN